MQKKLSEVVEERMKKVRIARRQQQGFTLIEMMVTVVLAGILLAIAIPSYRSITVGTHLRTTANKLVDGLNLARMEAIKRNTKTQFCGNGSNGSGALGAACGSQGGAVYTLTKDTSGADVAASIWGALSVSAPMQVQVTGLVFRPEGLAYPITGSAPYSGNVAVVCTDAITTDNQRVISMVTGSNITITTATGAC